MRRKVNERLKDPSFLGDLPPIPKHVILLDRQFLDTQGGRWICRSAIERGDLTIINWSRFATMGTRGRVQEAEVPPRTLHIVRLYASQSLTRKAPRTVCGEINALRKLFRWLFNLDQSPKHDLQLATIRESHFRGFLDRCLLSRSRGCDFQSIRLFLEWGVKQQIPDFDPKLVRRLRAIRAPGNLSGENVRSLNPTKGPLSREEINLIVDQLASPTQVPQDLAIVMLFLELGINPDQAAKLRNEDLISFVGNINGDIHSEFQLRVPRHKKRRPFRDTKQRAISQSLGQILRSLQRGAPSDSLLYWLPESRLSRGINEALKRFVINSNIVSPRTGKRLNLHARRFRYTLGTEAAEQGASDYHIAELLDHSNTCNVNVYRKTEPTIADRMERALDPALAPLAMRFQGQVVSSSEYPFARIPPAPIPGAAFHLPKYPLDLGGIGWCGLDLKTYGLCKQSPPLACYTCPKFAAWRDGPHNAVLYGLTNAIAALGETTDKRIPQELLETKTAVEQCIEQIGKPSLDTPTS